MAESWTERAARLLLEAAAEAQAGDVEGACTTASEAVYALRVELGEIDEPSP